MLKRLIEITGDNESLSEWCFVLNSVEIKENLVLNITVNYVDYDTDEDKHAEWVLICKDVKEHQLVMEETYSFEYFGENENHVLKWKHSMPMCSISFRGKPKNLSKVLGELYFVHFETVADWIPLNKFFNEFIDLKTLIAGGFGRLAEEVPKILALEYEEVLKENDISVTLSEFTMPKKWRNGKWVENTKPLSVILFDDSFIVAEEFEAKEISSKIL